MAFVVFGLVCSGGAYLGFREYTKSFREKAATYDLDLIRDVERPNIILDRYNREVGRIFVENRSEIAIEQVPQKMIDALVAGEDKRFFTHGGVDYQGIIRAAKGNFQSGKTDSGASTLTMQLARNAFPLQKDAEDAGGDKYDRKFVEIFLAERIEERFSKDQIMELYLNRVPFGSGFYGVRSASLGYFGKEPHELEVWECASLVGCIKNPSVFSPLRSKENNKKSRDNVLKRMQVEGFITAEDSERYQGMPVVVNPKPLERGTSYFYDRVAAFVKKNVPESLREEGGLRIFTTLDKSLQDKLEEGIRNQLFLVEKTEGYEHPKYLDFVPKAGKKTDYLQGAGLCYNHKTGEVLAYVGGRDFAHSQYDFIQAGQRPLGTAFLPVVYAASLENGGNLSQPVIDEAMDNRSVMVSGQEGILAEWGAEVMDPRYEGFIPARKGLAYSKIAATVRLGKEVGLNEVSKTATQLGFSMPRSKVDRRVLTRGLIGSESSSVLAASQAYAAIGNKGKRPEELIWMTRIEDQNGTLIYQAPMQVESKQVLSEKTAYLLHTALQDVWKKGNLTESYKQGEGFKFEGGVKTGTTYNFGDHWALGYNGDISCAVWAGFFSGQKPIFPGAFAKESVFPVWQEVMAHVGRNRSPEKVERPDGIIALQVCSRSGLRCTSDCYVTTIDKATGKEVRKSTGVVEYFEKGSEPSGFCDVHGDGAGMLVELPTGVFDKELHYVLPVKPEYVPLIGEDPYGAIIPEFQPLGSRSPMENVGTYGAVLERLDQLDREATIYLAPPGRLHVDE